MANGMVFSCLRDWHADTIIKINIIMRALHSGSLMITLLPDTQFVVSELYTYFVSSFGFGINLTQSRFWKFASIQLRGECCENKKRRKQINFILNKKFAFWRRLVIFLDIYKFVRVREPRHISSSHYSKSLRVLRNGGRVHHFSKPTWILSSDFSIFHSGEWYFIQFYFRVHVTFLLLPRWV